MKTSIQNRKSEHIQIARHSKDADRRKFYFDGIRLMHRALPEINYDQIDTSTTFLGKKLSFPLIISCMTGGRAGEIVAINRNLALAAEQTGIAMGTGSMRVLLEDESARPSFDLRALMPTTPLCGNLGAVQLAAESNIPRIVQLVDQLGLDAFYIHLNPLQEAVQPEGETAFAGLADRIHALVEALPVPVIAKEVGSGMSPADARLLAQAGVRFLDVAGAGGTSWSRIEYERDDAPTNPGRVFEDWGLPTPTTLRLLHPYRDRVNLIASGGLRTGLDMTKALVLGASLCGIARPLLEPALESPEAVAAHIRILQREFRTAMFLLGISRVDELIDNHALLLTPFNEI